MVRKSLALIGDFMKRFILSIALAILVAAECLAGVTRPVTSQVSVNPVGVVTESNRSQGYGDYSLYLDLSRYGTRDMVSRQSLVTSAAASRTLDGQTFTATQASIVDGQLRGVGVVRNLITSPNDMTVSPWVYTGSPVITATTFKATAQNDTTRQYISTVDGVYYTISAFISVAVGGQTDNYYFQTYNSESSALQDIGLLSTTPTKYTKTVLGKVGGGSVRFGFLDQNTSNWATVTITDWQITASPYPLPTNVSGSASVTEAGITVSEDIETKAPKLWTSLNGPNAKGSAKIPWKPMFDQADLIGPDIPRTFAVVSGSPTITGDQVEFINEISSVKDTAYWVVGKRYRINATISDYIGTGYIVLSYDGVGGGTTYDVNGVSLSKTANGTYSYDYIPTGTSVAVYSAAGHTATVTINSIKELKDCIIAQSGSLKLWYNADGYLRLTDGTNTASVALECVAETQYYIHPRWLTDTMAIGYSTDGETVAWGADATFAGSFTPGEDLTLLNSTEYQYIGPVINVEKEITAW